ncbi:MAG: omptin family outer membrane protease [Spirochaetes bacterium]|nr:omptin family outer membrane protease [Spirochaetota bacterium]
MKKVSISLFLLFVLLFTDRVFGRFSFEPTIYKLWGNTTYHIRFSENDPVYGTVYGDSELEYPLDIFMIGLNTALEFDLSGKRDLSFYLSAVHNITDPHDPMIDSDWITVPSYGVYNDLWSYTESDTRLYAWEMDISGGYSFINRLYYNSLYNFQFILGYRYHRYDYDIIGINYGWQETTSGEQTFRDSYKDQTVLKYLVSYHIPYLGLRMDMDSPSGLEVGMQFSYSPYTFARDHDDHVLRYKEARTESSGTTIMAETKFVCPVIKSGSSITLLQLGFHYINIKTEGKQKQYFYGDDPGSAGDETGLELPDIDNKVYSYQYVLSFSIVSRF